eukprot:TRINITY_DN29878_c0_g1_i1.p1 TRINITY_DN29878_c0_g1~~TRINITY_DN29878_c0_g1_i1.p1  ORF type:complete len:221 (-),score=12.99 TRINITY_DN29878_c0_g1_i1:110-748(-)
MLGVAVLAAVVCVRRSRGHLHKNDDKEDESPSTGWVDPTSNWKQVPRDCVASGRELFTGKTDSLVTATGKPLNGYAHFKLSASTPQGKDSMGTMYYGLFTNNCEQLPAVAYCSSTGQIEYRGKDETESVVVATVGKDIEASFELDGEGVTVEVGGESVLFPGLQPPPGCAFAPLFLAVGCPEPLTVSLDISGFFRPPKVNYRKARGRGKRGQ